MIRHPSIGQQVQVWYATKPKRRGGIVPSEVMKLHGKVGRVKVIAAGPGPRNHGVAIEGEIYFVPAGNLRRP